MRRPPAPRAEADGLDLGHLLGIVRENGKLVVLIAGVLFFAVMIYCLTSATKFRATGQLYLGEDEASSNVELASGSMAVASNEIEVLRSRTLVRRAVLAAGLNVSIAPPGWEKPMFWQWLASDRDPALMDVSADRISAIESTLDDNIVEARSYRVRFLDNNTYVLEYPGAPPVQGKLRERLSAPGLSLTLVPGSLGPAKGDEFDVAVAPLDTVVSRVSEALTITVPKGDQVRILTLEFTSGSRLLSAAFLNHLMHAYLETRHAWKTEDASAAEKFLTEQLSAMRESLDKTQDKLTNYRTENRAVVLEEEAATIAAQLKHYEEQRITARLQISGFKEIKKALQNPNQPLEAYLIGEADDAVLRQLATSLTEARQKLSTLSNSYQDGAPDLRQTKGQVADQLATIRNYVDGRLSRAEKQLDVVSSVIADYDNKLQAIPSAQRGLARIDRESDVYSKMYTYLLERRQQAAITKASTVSKNRILDVPVVPRKEDSPRLVLYLASSVLCLLVGVAIVILRGLFSGVFRRENDVRGVLGQVQVFGRVPLLLMKSRTKATETTSTVPMFNVMAPEIDPSFTEAFRSLRANLYRVLPGVHGKVLLVTSPTPGDGKTTCALSLAAMLAADNRRVLVVDADIRKPTHHVLLGVPRSPGLDEIMRQKPGADRSAIRTFCLAAGWFDSLCVGSNPTAELLSAQRFATFLVEARSRYDFVVIDSSSFPAISDSLVLAPLSDFVLSVMRLGHTPRKLAEEHLDGMFTGSLGCAVVVNNAATRATMPIMSPNPPRLATAGRRLLGR